MMRFTILCVLLLYPLIGLGEPLMTSRVMMNQAEFLHDTVGTSAQAAIASASVKADLYAFHICMDAEATATYLAIGENADPLVDGVRIGPDTCFICNGCSPAILKAIKVKAQAASTGYSVLQFRQ